MSRRIALYAGSFDPYTNGHHAIVRKAATLFDEVVVMIAVNIAKTRAFAAESMRDAIQAAVDADNLNVRVVLHTGLIADYCRENGIEWYVRGLRNNVDYDYEENIARINHLINPRLETLYLRADESAISSSMIRELLSFGASVREFLPRDVMRIMETSQRSLS